MILVTLQFINFAFVVGYPLNQLTKKIQIFTVVVCVFFNLLYGYGRGFSRRAIPSFKKAYFLGKTLKSEYKTS